MELSGPMGLAAVAALLFANGFFVAAEFAIVAVRRSRLEQMVSQGDANASAALRLVNNLNIYIAACQVGITLASLLLGWIGAPALAHLIEPPLEALVGQFAPAAAHGIAIGIALALITSLHIIVGEQAPKGFALQRPEVVSLLVARPLQLFEFIFRWPTGFLNYLTNALLRGLGLRPTTGHEAVHTVEELRMLVTGSELAGMVEASEARIATRAFTFADLTAGALMTPRTEVDAVPLAISQEALAARLVGTTYTRLPVYQNTLDNIVGVLYVPDFYRAVTQATPEKPFELRSILRGTMIVPESKPADDLLNDMRAAGRYFAVVIDEYGGTAGILTLEDLMEALVGPLPQESLISGRAVPPTVASVEPDGSLVMDGLMRLEEWEEATGLRLDEADHEAVETVGGLLMARLGRMPAEGDEIDVAGRTLRVEQLDGLRVALVRLMPVAVVAGGAGVSAISHLMRGV